MAEDSKACFGTHQPCKHCGMDMDMEPFCVNPPVLALRTEQSGRDYPFGLDINVALPLCKFTYWELRPAPKT